MAALQRERERREGGRDEVRDERERGVGKKSRKQRWRMKERQGERNSDPAQGSETVNQKTELRDLWMSPVVLQLCVKGVFE